MAYSLQFTVIHASPVETTKEIEYEGAPATITTKRTLVEATPNDGSDRTLTLLLEAAASEEVMIGATINASFEFVDPTPEEVTAREAEIAAVGQASIVADEAQQQQILADIAAGIEAESAPVPASTSTD